MVDLRQVQAFVAVVQTGSFTQAAHRLHIGQSGLSAQIKKLEQTIGGQLFDRRPTGVVPTELGREMFVHAQDLLASAERFCTASKMPGAKRMLRLGVAENGVNELALALMRRIRTERPDVDLEVRPVALRRQHDALADGAEVLIGRPPFDGSLPDRCTTIPTAVDPLVLVAHDSRPEADALSIAVADVVGLSRLRTTWVPEAWRARFAVFDEDGTDESLSIGVTTFREAMATVNIRHTACVMPASFARTYNVPDVVAVPITDVEPMTIEIVYDPEVADDVVAALPELLAAGDLMAERTNEAVSA